MTIKATGDFSPLTFGFLRKPKLYPTLVEMLHKHVLTLHAIWLQLISDGPFSVGLVDNFLASRAHDFDIYKKMKIDLLHGSIYLHHLSDHDKY